MEVIKRATRTPLFPLPTSTSTSMSTSLSTHTHTHVTPIPSVLPVPIEPIYQEIGKLGSRTLWVVFVLMLLSTIVFGAMAYRVPVQKRLFHLLTTFITLFATVSYFAMASGDGYSFSRTVNRTSHKHGPDTEQNIFRQVFFARYIDWTVTTPLLLLDLAFLAGLSGANILVAVVADVLMVLTGLFAAYGREGGQKWGYYTISCAAYLVIVYLLAVSGRRNAAARDSKAATFYTAIAVYTVVIWTAYPIVWAIGDGSRHMSVNAEVVTYAILDILAKPVFGFWLLVTHERLVTTNIHLDGAWSHGFGKREGTLRVGDDDDGA
ncbi:MAG: hypothetical protein M1826_004757 [Phylliscum demangeonii]|nr:MAG: hypothetical protein M1826_004757 [Phylliscum demangeonii]